jgi:hypothetical protein
MAGGGPQGPGHGTPPPPGDCQYGAVTLGDDVELPAGVSCTMDGTQVRGNLKLGRDTSLVAANVFVDGNVQAEGAWGLVLVESDVDGDVQFKQGGRVEIRDSVIGGNLQLDSNRGDLYAGTTRIGGDLQAFQNRGGFAIAFTRNTIDGNLQCKENSPRPTGGSNVVGGNKEDQCRSL